MLRLQPPPRAKRRSFSRTSRRRARRRERAHRARRPCEASRPERSDDRDGDPLAERRGSGRSGRHVRRRSRSGELMLGLSAIFADSLAQPCERLARRARPGRRPPRREAQRRGACLARHRPTRARPPACCSLSHHVRRVRELDRSERDPSGARRCSVARGRRSPQRARLERRHDLGDDRARDGARGRLRSDGLRNRAVRTGARCVRAGRHRPCRGSPLTPSCSR